ncbi:mismatch-specific DNA-glycosylase [Microbacterium soli]|uniref:Uracil-DNA glycosylase-like domain-containing protein n=1 Tax=Microbacterium soli TaxID=446075 RepID=A0ABP7MY36_9MICO
MPAHTGDSGMVRGTTSADIRPDLDSIVLTLHTPPDGAASAENRDDGAMPSRSDHAAERPRFTRAELSAFTGGTLPDLLPDPTLLLFAGINPGLLSVAVQAHFAPRGNRFFPALAAAGIVDRRIDASAGMLPADEEHLRSRGVGITSIVRGATSRASELTAAQLRAGGADLRERVAGIRPRVVALLGITAYRTAFDAPHALVGRQPGDWDGAEVWVVPNPSGLNRHHTTADLAQAYREVALRAGIRPPA